VSAPLPASVLPPGLRRPGPRDSELVRIVCVNEEIKAIVATAFRINLMALNAIFLAKRAGRAALGFGVLSNELRRFAQDLTRAMGGLREMTAGSVGTVTGLMQQQRLNGIVAAAAEACQGRPVAGLAEATRRGTMRLQERRGRLRELDKRLREALADAGQLVELGGVLARSARIEAAYGGRYSAALMQVSSDFAGIINQIRQSLENLSRERLTKDER
jgi:methyl-accepting chemotaxis protein